MPVLARLSTILDANTSRFEAGMKRSRRSMRKFSDTVKRGAKRTAIGLGVVGTAFGALAIRQAAVIDQQAKLARSLGVNLKSFQAMTLVADEAGVAQAALGKAITTSQKAIFEAGNGLATYKRAFDELNLSVDELKEQSPDEQFNTIAEALSNVENSTEKTALALQIFGKNGRDLINVFDQYNERLQEARAFNDKFNLSLSEVDSAKVEEANDTFGRVGKAISGLGNTLAVEFAPVVTAVGQAFLDGGFDAQRFGDLVRKGMVIAAQAIDVVRQSLLGMKLIFANVSKFMDAMVLNATTNLFNLAESAKVLPGFAEKMKTVQQELLILNEAAQISGASSVNRIKELEKEIKNFIPLADKLKKLQLEATARAEKATQTALPKKEFEGFTELVTDAKEEQNKLAKEGEKAFSDFADALKNGEDAADSFKKVVLNSISAIAESVIKNLGDDLFSGLFQKSGAGAGGGGIGGAIGGALGGFVESAVSGVGGFLKGVFPSFAVGSFNVPSDMVANIHKGEMIIPAREAAQIRSGGGAGGGGVTIQQNVTIGNDVTAAVRQEISKAMPELKRASVEAVQDARLRGAEV